LVGLGAWPWAGGGRLAVGAVAFALSNGVGGFLQIVCLWEIPHKTRRALWNLAAVVKHAFSPAAKTAVNVGEIRWNIFG
jgi:hypothetical protein